MQNSPRPRSEIYRQGTDIDLKLKSEDDDGSTQEAMSALCNMQPQDSKYTVSKMSQNDPAPPRQKSSGFEPYE